MRDIVVVIICLTTERCGTNYEMEETELRNNGLPLSLDENNNRDNELEPTEAAVIKDKINSHRN